MQAKGKYGKTRMPRDRKITLNRCLFAALALLSLYRFLPSETYASNSVYDHVHVFLSKHSDDVFQNHPDPSSLNMAVETLTVPEDDDETEGLDLDFHFPFIIFIPENLPSDPILSELPELPLQAGVAVPLFILYHSWKTFAS